MATFHFEAKELGTRLTEAELDELKKSRYGDVRGGRQANLAESPAQLLLEAASAKQIPSKKAVPEVQQSAMPPKPSASASKASETQVDDKKKLAASGDGLNKAPKSSGVTSPVKQREYRRPDGRKRIIPEAVGVPLQQENISSQATEFPRASSVNGNEDNMLVVADGGVRENSARLTKSSGLNERSGATARATIIDSLVIEKVSVAAGRDGCFNVEQSGSMAACGSTNNNTFLIRVFDKKEGDSTVPTFLEASPREHSMNDIVGMGKTFVLKETDITCKRGSETLWSDRISGKVNVLAGNTNFWAVGCEDGCVQVCHRILFCFVFF